MRKLWERTVGVVLGVPAALLFFTAVLLMSTGAALCGKGFLRNVNILLEEFRDALVFAKVRQDIGKRK